MGILTTHSTMLLELRSFEKRQLRTTETIVTSPMGHKFVERLPVAQEDEDDLQRRKLALKKLLAIRESQVDKQPVLVEDGLFVGPGGALLPTGHFTNSKRRQLDYHHVPVYDDASQDIASHFADTNAFIAKAIDAGGRVLVHCYAGQSRSIAFAMAYLIGVRHCSLADAWARVQAARPTAHPNSGFVAQLQRYARQCGVDASLPSGLTRA